MKAVFVEREGAEVVVARGVELVGGERRARGKDARELAADEFAGFGGLGLVADRDFFSGGEQFGDVVVRGVGGQSGHRGFLPFGQREPEETRGDDGVVEEQLEEIAQPKQQQRVARQSAFHLEILLPSSE